MTHVVTAYSALNSYIQSLPIDLRYPLSSCGMSDIFYPFHLSRTKGVICENIQLIDEHVTLLLVAYGPTDISVNVLGKGHCREIQTLDTHRLISLNEMKSSDFAILEPE